MLRFAASLLFTSLAHCPTIETGQTTAKSWTRKSSFRKPTHANDHAEFSVVKEKANDHAEFYLAKVLVTETHRACLSRMQAHTDPQGKGSPR